MKKAILLVAFACSLAFAAATGRDALAQAALGNSPGRPDLAALRSEDPKQRLSALNRLEEFGLRAAAVPDLVRLAREDKDQQVRQRAGEELLMIGQPAVEPLLAGFTDEPHGDDIARLLGRIRPAPALALLRHLQSTDARARELAIAAFSAMGPDARPAVGELARIVMDQREPLGLRTSAAGTLGTLGTVAAEGVPALATVLSPQEEPSGAMRISAAMALESIGSTALNALPMLTAALSDNEPIVRASAARTIARFESAARAALPTLIGVYESAKEIDLRGAALQAVAAAGDHAAVSLFVQALSDSDPLMRHQALDALQSSRANIREFYRGELAAAVAARLTDVRRNNRMMAVRVLQSIGGDALVEIVPKLAGATEDSDPAIRQQALQLLSSVRERQDVVLPLLIRALSDPSELVRRAATNGFHNPVPGREDVGDRLCEVAETDMDDGVRVGAIQALGRLRRNTPKVAAVLLRAMTSENDEVRKAAATALRMLKLNPSQALPPLLSLYHHGTPQARRAALDALSGYAETSKEVRALILESIDDHLPSVAGTALRASQELVADDPDAILPVVLPKLQSPNSSLRLAALSVFQRRGDRRPPHQAILAIAELVRDPNFLIRQNAVNILAYTPISETAAEALAVALADTDLNVSQNALDAFGSITTLSPATRASLEDLQRGGNPRVRIVAASVLLRTGNGTVESIRILTEAVRSTVEQESLAAAKGLAAAGRPDRGRVQPGLSLALRSRYDSVRAVAAEAYAANPALARAELQTLLDLVGDPVPPVRAAALSAVRMSGVVDDRLVNTVARAAADPDADVRNEAGQSLGAYQRVSTVAVAALRQLLEQHDGQHRKSVLRGLNHAQHVSPELEASFINLLSDRNVQVRQEAANVAARMSPAPDGLIDALVAALRDQDATVVRNAIASITNIGFPARRAVPALLENLDHPDDSVAAAAFGALSMLRVSPEKLGSALDRALADPLQIVQNAALYYLFNAGAYPDRLVPSVLAVLGHADSETRAAALQALAVKGPDVRDALPRVQRLVQDPSPDVRGAALRTLAAIDPDGSSAADAALRVLRGADRRLAAVAYEIIARHPDKGTPAVPVVEALLGQPADPAWPAALRAAVALGMDQTFIERNAMAAIERGPPATYHVALTALARTGNVAQALDHIEAFLARGASSDHNAILNAVAQIALLHSGSGDTALADRLERLLDQFRRSRHFGSNQLILAASVENSIRQMRKSSSSTQFAEQVGVLVRDYGAFLLLLGGAMSFIALCAVVGVFYPRAYLAVGSLDRVLPDVVVRFRTADDERVLRIPLRKIAGIGLLDWNERASRAWMDRYYRSVRLLKRARTIDVTVRIPGWRRPGFRNSPRAASREIR